MGRNHTVLTADVDDEIIVTIQGNDETTGSKDMVFLKAESDEPLFATVGGFTAADGAHIFLNSFASEQNPFQDATPTIPVPIAIFGFQPSQNHTGFIPKGDNSVSGWDTTEFQAIEIRNANAGERWQFGVKFTVNSENFNALHIKVHGGFPNAVTGASGTINDCNCPVNSCFSYTKSF